jgi:hypothetical protein
MLNREEARLVYEVSKRWTGPNTWAWFDKQRLDLSEAITVPGYG